MRVSNVLQDLLISIKNGQLVKKDFVHVSNNRLCFKFLRILYQEGYIRHYSVFDSSKIKIWLKYYNNFPVIQNMCFYPVKKNSVSLNLVQLWKLDCDFKLVILSTTKGFLSGRMSRKKKVGGILLCSIS